MNKILKSTVICLVIGTLLCSSAFAAIPAGHWFESIAKTVDEKGFYLKITQESFDPDASVTYSEFAIMATVALGRAIAYNGDKANDPISRITILKIINERMGYSVDKLTDDQKIMTALKIADFNTISQNEKDIAMAACEKGLVLGNENGEIRPTDNATYAEALTMLSRVPQE